MQTNDRMRKRFTRHIAPDTRIEAVLSITRAKGPPASHHKFVLGRYMQRYGLTNTLGPARMFHSQWLVLTENRFLLFSKKGIGLGSRTGKLQHALDRTEVSVQWADFAEAVLRKRLIHLTTTDQRMNISQSILGTSDEHDLFVQAIGDRGRQIGLQEL